MRLGGLGLAGLMLVGSVVHGLAGDSPETLLEKSAARKTCLGIGNIRLVSDGRSYDFRTEVPATYAKYYEAYAQLGFVRVMVDERFQSHASGGNFSWGALLEQTTEFVEGKIFVEVLEAAKSYVEDGMLCIPNGSVEGFSVVKVDEKAIAGEPHRVVFATFIQTNGKAYRYATGAPEVQQMKVIGLYRNDVFSSDWRPLAVLTPTGLDEPIGGFMKVLDQAFYSR